jgi:nucleoside-diphosphate-sugar epimerase
VKVLVTGGAGYLGSVLVPKLLARGHLVRVLDVGYFGVGHLRMYQSPVELLREDIRRLCTDVSFADEVLEGCECVIHLAAISNDPSADLNPDLTYEVNMKATQVLGVRAKERGLKFLFSSSCSVYGEADGEIDEDGALNPLTVYARSKVDAEQMLADLADESWRPVILRNGTLFGYSPRMRFDLVANIFALQAALKSEISIFGNGLQWRPFLHVSDCARAFVHFAERQDHENLIYNIAHENLRIVDLAEIFAAVAPLVRVNYLDVAEPDHRNYRVSANRMRAEGFRPQTGMQAGVEALIEALISGAIPDPESIYYRNAKWLTELSQVGQKSHKDIVKLMETLVTMHQGARV